MTNAGEVEIGAGTAVMIEKSSVICWHRKKKRGAITLNVRVNAGGSWAIRREERGCSARKREVAGIAKTIREK